MLTVGARGCSGPVAEAYEYNTPCEHSSGKGFWATLYFVVYVVIAGAFLAQAVSRFCQKRLQQQPAEPLSGSVLQGW